METVEHGYRVESKGGMGRCQGGVLGGWDRTGGERAGRENRVCWGLRWYSEARDEERRGKGESEHERARGVVRGCGGRE